MRRLVCLLKLSLLGKAVRGKPPPSGRGGGGACQPGPRGIGKAPARGVPGLAGRRPEQPGRGPAPSCQLLAEGGQA